MSGTATAAAVSERFLDALTRRDYDALAACFTEDASLRAIVPPGLREADGPEAIAERFRIWTADIADYEIEATVEPFADLTKLSWVVTGDEGKGPETFEQVAYAEISDAGILRMRLVCSGGRPL